MVNAKREVLELLEQLPDDVTMEDIQYHLYVRQKVEAGLEAADKGRTLSQKDMEERMRRWFANGR